MQSTKLLFYWLATQGTLGLVALGTTYWTHDLLVLGAGVGLVAASTVTAMILTTQTTKVQHE